MLKYFLLVTLFCLYEAEGDDTNVFEKLSELNEKWLQAHSMPEAATLLKLPPYVDQIRGPDSSVSVSKIPLLKNETYPTPEGSIKSCKDVFYLKSDWAREMLDSNGKLSSGILRGGLIWPGHFEECNSVYAPDDNKGHGGFHGKYCITSWTLEISKKYSKLPLTIGICIPDTCSENRLKNDVENALDIIVFVCCFVLLVVLGSAMTVKNYKRKQHVTNMAEERNAQGADRNSDLTETSAINSARKSYDSCQDMSSLIENPELGLSSVSFQKKKEYPIMKRILLCFSAIENGQKILNTNTSEGQLRSVHGIRFLSLTWVILGHTYISSMNMIGNRIDVLKEIDTVPFQVLLQAPFAVDSFFLLGGFLLAYLFLKEADKKKWKNKITPAYMVVVFFYIFVFKYVGSGPFWDDNHCDDAHTSWWKYLLYINNFIPIHKMCIGWSWYLANDMQFYLISPLFLYPLWRWPRVGFSILALTLISTWTATGVLSYKYDLIPMFVGATHAKDFNAYAEKMWNSFDLIYDKPYCRIAPYIIGIILGFILNRINKRKNFMNWWQQTLGWTVAAFCSLSVVFGLYHVQMDRLTAAFYNALCRSSFSIGLAWIIFVCETGHGSFIAKILSWKALIPLSRITFCAYLVHPILIHGYYYAYRSAIHFTELFMVTNFMGFFIMSYGIAFFFSLTFESPLTNLEKLVLKNKSR